MGNIVLLDDLTINKIAAGEVIERPASVIKEMVENSIDAGATNITVEIKNGGISFIRITDNGKGIAKDDVEIAFERHATSKIRCAEDLTTVKSMGFRGEALASIAAISNVELASKTGEDDIGTRIVVEGGKVLSLDEIACSKGTTITVRNLFFNTPVRYKFLKKDFTESGYIEDVITRIALVHPEISIKLINTGKTVIQTNGNGDINGVIYNIYGKEVATNLLDVEYEYEYLKVKGVVGKPEIARSNRSNQIFFINDRYIKNKTLSSAVEQAFKGMLPFGKFAYLVLNIEMDPSKVDVNVHPAKLEVRFEDENTVFKAVYHAIKDVLSNQGIISDKEKIQEINKFSQDAFKIPSDDVKKKIENTYKIENKEVFENLRKLQADLRKEISEDSSLKLTEEYKEMEEQYNNNGENELVATEEFSDNVLRNQNEKEEKIIPIMFEKSEIVDNNENLEEIKIESQDGNLDETKLNENAEINEENNIEEIKNENLKNDSEEIKEEIAENCIEETEEEIKENSVEEIKENIIETNDGSVDNILENTPEEKTQEETTGNFENNETTQNEANLNDNKDKKGISFREMYKEIFGKEPYGGKVIEQEEKKEAKEEKYYTIDTDMQDGNITLFDNVDEYGKIQYKIIGKAFDNYVIIEIQNELYIMDEKIAYEKIMYENLKRKFYNSKENEAQLLLLPDIVTLTNKEMDIAKDNMKLFNKLGFVFEEFGDNTIKLSGVPDSCVELETAELFKEILTQIDKIARTDEQEKENKFISVISKKIAEQSNVNLDMEELDNLISELLETNNPFIDLNGKPTVIKLSKYEIERKFARK